jgi:hypothetical protein
MSGTNFSRWIVAFASVAVVSATACTSDRIAGPTRILENRSEGRGVFQRYFAVGTSVSAGVQSDGLIAATQATSWPAQLAAAAGRTLNQPLIDGTGCRSPLVAPLASGVRLSGEPAGEDASQLSCSALRSDVFLPVDNVGLNGARVKDALNTTPENITDAGNAKVYGRVLQPGQTQVSTMMAANPKLVSIELGANEVLEARYGIAIEGGNLASYDAFVADYDKVLDSVQKVTKMAVVVGLIDDLGHAAAFRAGNEIWNDRAEFVNFNVAIQANCQNSTNLVFIPFAVPTALQYAAFYAQHGLGPYPFSCAGQGPADVDFILTSSEQTTVNNLMHRMSAHIQAEAATRGFAYFALGSLYDRNDLKGPFSLGGFLGTAKPFGDYFSLDGLHPSALGQTVLARAAAQALNDRYDLGIPQP